MRLNKLAPLAVLAFVTLSLFSSQFIADAQTRNYAIQKLDPPPFFYTEPLTPNVNDVVSGCAATAISPNTLGDAFNNQFSDVRKYVVGTCFGKNGTPASATLFAAMWRIGGAANDKPNFIFNSSEVLRLNAVNDFGEAVGYTYIYALDYNRNGSYSSADLSYPLAGGANGINKNGVIVGWTVENNLTNHPRATMWFPSGKGVDLHQLFGLTGDSIARSINDNGQIVIRVCGSELSSCRALLYDRNAGLSEIGNFSPSKITNHGYVIGDAMGSPVIWSKQDGVRPFPLGALQSASGVPEVFDVNNHLERVGAMVDPQHGIPLRAVLWTFDGSAIDLNTMIPASSGWVLTAANGISDTGEIVGEGLYNGQRTAFILTPQYNIASAFPTTHGTDLGCDAQMIARPEAQTIRSRYGWSMTAEVSDRDGLVLHDVKLNHRYMAERISIPYYMLQTFNALANVYSPLTRGELKPDGDDATLRSRLVSYNIVDDGAKLSVEASYVIDRIPDGSQSCLNITQRYEFYSQGTGCEPSSTLPCSRFKPIVEYKINGQNEYIQSLNIVQRNHFMVNGAAGNSGAVFQDCDVNPVLCVSQGGGVIFNDKINPLLAESNMQVIMGGLKVNNSFDNYHQTFGDRVDEPSWPDQLDPRDPGCPSCVHIHWRWGVYAAQSSAPFDGNGGRPIIPDNSKQDVEISVVRNHAGEEHPSDFHSLANGEQLQFSTPDPNPDPVLIPTNTTLYDLIFFYSATGHQNSDSFNIHGGFFNGSLPDVKVSFNGGAVNFADQYQDGQTTVANFDPSAETPLPSGYTPYNPTPTPTPIINYDSALERGEDSIGGGSSQKGKMVRRRKKDAGKNRVKENANAAVAVNDTTAGNPLPFAFDIETQAVTSAPYTVTFNLNRSDLNLYAPNSDDYSKLRVLHLESGVWVDRTVRSTPQHIDLFAPTSDDGIVQAMTDSLGKFIIVSESDQPQPTNHAPTVKTKNITVAVGNSCAASIQPGDLDAGTFDQDAGDTFTLSLDAATLFGVGQHTVTLTARDSHGATSSATAIVTLIDTTPPTITAPANLTVATGASATSCGITISDTALGVAAAQDNCAGVTITRSGVPANNFFPVGTTTITYTATDASGNSATATQTVTVIDTTPPTIFNLAVDKPTLRPPNHKMIDVAVNYTVTDNCAGTVITALSISSNESVNGTGDGNSSTDWQVIDSHHVQLRAERSGNGSGRIYTITVTATDAKGNSSQQSVQVSVPH